MSARTSSSTIFFGDDTTEVRAKANKGATRSVGSTGVSHIFGGPESADEMRPSTRIREPGGTGGKSTLFDPDPVPVQTRVKDHSGTGGKSTLFDPDPVQQPSTRPVQPNPLTEAPAEPVRLSTKPLQPGGTGGRSSVFTEEEDSAKPSPPTSQAYRHASPFATDDGSTPAQTAPVRTSAKILQPGGTGGASRVFEPTVEQVQQSVSKLNVSSPVSDSGSISGDEAKKHTSSQRSGGGPSKVFASSEDEDHQTWSGRKVEAGRTNMSQVALGGGYPDSEPQNRTARRGKIRADYNQSQIMFGDDTGGEPVKERPTTTTSSRVLRPGGTGGGSQIAFGDDTNGQPVVERKAGTSTKVLRPGGLGGTSQITFGDDTGGAPVVGRTSSKVNRPGGMGGTSQINFAHDSSPPSSQQPTKTSSRVLRPGGTGGTSQITF